MRLIKETETLEYTLRMNTKRARARARTNSSLIWRLLLCVAERSNNVGIRRPVVATSRRPMSPPVCAERPTGRHCTLGKEKDKEALEHALAECKYR